MNNKTLTVHTKSLESVSKSAYSIIL